MRFLRIMLVLVFAAVAVFYGMNQMNSNAAEAQQGPEFSCSDDVLNVSVTNGPAALLRGITAQDPQDGNLTDRIIISGVSKLLEGNTAKVTYVVVDSDNNMATLTRQIRYTDYESPRFSLTEPLVYSSTQNVSLLDRLHAVDAIDGDISHNIRVSYLEETDDPSRYTMDVKVTNTMGDTVELTLPVTIREEEKNVPAITLSSYLVYLNRGDAFDAESYIEEITYEGSELYSRYADISGEVKTDVPGTYLVTYSYTRGDATGTVLQVVVVE